MNRRTYFLLTVSILGAANLSCHGPDSAALAPEAPKTEIEARWLESNHDGESHVDKTQFEKELIVLDGLAASFL
jgi:hypothetical protein